ncbi:hypothetical protein BDY24DRAFT_114718 [Mrakia frigida]|uniref:uncharacterized protein n=1 Tax=Mrakia frigida TaxID=29902 RepID=UPI003FCBF029
MPSITPEPEPHPSLKALLSTLPDETKDMLTLLKDWPWGLSRCRDEINYSKELLGDYHFPSSTLREGEEWICSVEPLLRPERRKKLRLEQVSKEVNDVRLEAGDWAVEFRETHMELDLTLLSRQTRSEGSTTPCLAPTRRGSELPKFTNRRPSCPTASQPQPTPSSSSSLLTPIENTFRLSQHISIASYTFIRDAYLAGQTSPIGLTHHSTERKCRLSVGKWLVKEGRIASLLVEVQARKGMGTAVVGKEARGRGTRKREITEVEEVENLLGSPPSPPLSHLTSISQTSTSSISPKPPKPSKPSPSPSSSPPPSPSLPSSTARQPPHFSTSKAITTALIRILSSSPQLELCLMALYSSITNSNPTLFPPSSPGWKAITRAVLSRGKWFEKTKDGLWKLRTRGFDLE